MVITFPQLKDVEYADGFELRLPLLRSYVFGLKSGGSKTWKKGWLLLVDEHRLRKALANVPTFHFQVITTFIKKAKFQLPIGCVG
jgi:hypothetical protein